MRLALCLVVGLAAACAPTKDELHRLQSKAIDEDLVLMSPSSQMIIQNKNGVVCFAPAPDAAQQIGGDVSIVLPFTVTLGEPSQANAFDDQIPLGGRNPNVLITRALLFEACMVEARSDMSKDERLAHWERTLKAIETINTGSLEGSSIQSDNFNASLPTAPTFSSTGQSGGTSSSTSTDTSFE